MSKKKKEKLKFDPTKCNPNAKIGEYFIYIYHDVPENCTGGYIGFIGNHANENLCIRIKIDNDFMKERNHRFVCLLFDENHYSEAEIVITSAFWHAWNEHPFLDAAVLHEIGHYHTTRYFQSVFIGNSTQKRREEFLSKGEIMPEETAADLFALYYTSKEIVTDEINWFIKSRKSLTWEPADKNTKAVYEMGRRKRYVNSFNTEEEIKEALCKLCNVDVFDDI